MFVTPAYAQAAAAAPGAQGLVQFMLPIALIFVVFYFLLIRPQQKKARDHKEMVDNIRRGDQVVTAGGIYGKVIKAGGEDGKVTVEIAPNVRIDVVAGTIAEVLNKTKPGSAPAKKDRKDKGKEQAEEKAEADAEPPAAGKTDEAKPKE